MRAHHLALATLVAMLAWAPSAHATFPARNGPIAFSIETDAGFQIHTVRDDGRELRQITRVDGDAVHPDWSPDGRRIVFELGTEETANVAIVDADGRNLVLLPTSPGVFEGQPSFTPDGRRIVFERFDSVAVEVALWSMRLDGGDRRRIPTAEPIGVTDPNVSPDGRRLSFVGLNWLPFGQALFTSDLDGSDALQLTPFTFDVAIKQDWAPNGRRLAFTDNADFPEPGDSANMATIRPDGTGLRYLTHFRGGETNAFTGSYSPDGRWIVFRLEDHGRFGLYKISRDGRHVRAIRGFDDVAPRYIDWGPRRCHQHHRASDKCDS